MSHILQIDNIYSYLLTNDTELKDTLWRALRYRKKDFYYPAYRNKGWDGYFDFFDKKTGRFLTGLLPEVEYALKYKFKINYTIKDGRKNFDFKYTNITNQFLNHWMPEGKTKITLYDYQVDLINQATQHKRGIVKAPTGAGKTNIFIGIMRALPPNTPTLVLTDTINLTMQNYSCLKELGFENVGLFYGKSKKIDIITCCTVQSVKKLEEHFKHFKVLIVDEIHACMSKVPISVYRKMKHTPVRIGISATPFGNNCKVQKFLTKGFFGAPFKTKATDSGELSTGLLQGRGILSGSDCTFIEVDEPQLPYEIFSDAVKYGIAENHHFHGIVKKLALQKCKGRTLILVERLVQGDALASIIPGAVWIQGKDDPKIREKVIEKLKTSDEIIAIVSQKIISKGLDVKLHNLINAAGGKSESSMIQRMGRGLRTADDKDILHYYDFLFNINDYLRDHSEERIKCLKDEGHPIRIVEEI